jgi:hypothetical protein
VIKLNEDDGYGVRDSLFKRAGEYLPETTLRAMIDELWIKAELTTDNPKLRGLDAVGLAFFFNRPAGDSSKLSSSTISCGVYRFSGRHSTNRQRNGTPFSSVCLSLPLIASGRRPSA